MIAKRYIDTPGGQMHVRVAGVGTPLLLLHQSPSSGAMWEPVLPLFAARGFHSIALDMPGYGASYCPEEPPSIESYSAAVLGALDALGQRRVDLVGHHTGASVALQVAVDAPQRVGRLVLWGVPILDPELQNRLENEPPPEYDDEGVALAAWWKRRRQLSGPAYGVALGVRAMVEMLQTGETRPWGHWAVARTDHRSLLRRISHPTLVMAGERDPVWSGSREAVSYIENGRFVAIANAGLDVADEFPQRFVAEIVDFLR